MGSHFVLKVRLFGEEVPGNFLGGNDSCYGVSVPHWLSHCHYIRLHTYNMHVYIIMLVHVYKLLSVCRTTKLIMITAGVYEGGREGEREGEKEGEREGEREGGRGGREG